MTIGILKEPQGENRVSALPDIVANFISLKVSVIVESGAGDNAFANDAAYVKVGAQIASREEVIKQADILLSIHQMPEKNLKSKAVLLGVYQPFLILSL